MSGAFAINWDKSGTYQETVTLKRTDKTIPENVAIKIDGDLTLEYDWGAASLTIKGTLYVTGDLKINNYCTLKMEEGSVLIVEGNLVQNTGATFLTKSYVNANSSLIIVKGSYDINGTFAGASGALDATKNEVYVFGEDKGVSGTLSESAFYKKYESFETVFLPIELTSFTATATEHGYTFNWVTASEKNNDYFTLEFSIDGVDFNEIDYIHGAGTTSETSEYEYVWDAKPKADILYFRLKQTDYNGEFTYSDILAYAPKASHGATRTLYYGPLKLNVVDGQLRYIENK